MSTNQPIGPPPLVQVLLFRFSFLKLDENLKVVLKTENSPSSKFKITLFWNAEL